MGWKEALQNRSGRGSGRGRTPAAAAAKASWLLKGCFHESHGVAATVGGHPLGTFLGQWVLEGPTAKQTKCYATMFPVCQLLKRRVGPAGSLRSYSCFRCLIRETHKKRVGQSVDKRFLFQLNHC